MAKFEVIENLSGGLYFLDGKRQTIEAAQQFDVFEPRIGKVVAKCPIADRQLVDKVCEAAHKAQPEWGKISPLERAKVLHKVAVIIRVSYFWVLSCKLPKFRKMLKSWLNGKLEQMASQSKYEFSDLLNSIECLGSPRRFVVKC